SLTSYLCMSSLSALRALHSFPTRRSSDLWLDFETRVSGAFRALVGHHFSRLANGASQIVVVSSRLDDPKLRAHTFRHHLAVLEIDRKSTRLNSSHVKISYAVFCLKKKNMT